MVERQDILENGHQEYVKEHKPEIILDIGPGPNNADNLFRLVKEKIEQGAIYIALDFDETKLKDARDNEHRNMALADAANLPFVDNSVDEIWLINVFGLLEKSLKRDVKGNLANSQFGGKQYNQVSDYIKELDRVLKPNKKIIIGEYFTPQNRTNQQLMGMNYENFGLRSRYYQNGAGLDEYLDELKTKNGIKGMIERNMFSYFLELTKQDENRD
jgi:ubiquinone/menaquinone biosynthesis C-methylase UbiE